MIARKRNEIIICPYLQRYSLASRFQLQDFSIVQKRTLMHFLNLDLNEFQKNLDISKIYIKDGLQSLKIGALENKARVLCWNIERGFYPNAILAYIKDLEPDIICLQEVDWRNKRTNNLDVLDYIAKKTGMLGFYAIEFYEIERPERSDKYSGGGVHGNAILTRIEPSSFYRIELPPSFNWEDPPKRLEKLTRCEPRIGARFALCAELQLGENKIIICSTHFEDKDGGVEGRVNQLNSLMQTLDNKAKKNDKVLIGGDFNTLDNWLARITGVSMAIQAQGKPWYISECQWWKNHVLPPLGLFDPFGCKDWTHQVAGVYREKLDWIAMKNCEVEDYGRGGFNTSDHRPLWVDIIL
jgi:endonuclease/exonuclease/phosphatase family metal-dependent hydrolase